MAMPAVQLSYLLIVWPLIYGRGMVTADLASGPMPETEPFLLNRLFFPAMAGLSLLLMLAERDKPVRFRLAGAFLLGGLFTYLGLAVTWALAPSVSLSKLVLLAMQAVALAGPVLLARRTEDVLRPVFWVMALTLAVNAAAVVALPATPIGHAGIYPHKNMLGEAAALAGFFAFYGISRRGGAMRAAGLVMLPLALGLLYLSQSKTSLALFFVCPLLALVALFARRWLRIALPLLLVLAAIPAAALLGGQLADFSYTDMSVVIGGDSTFTGRTDLWDFALAAIAERPLTGYGYQSFWGVEGAPQASLPDGFLRRTPHAHNGYLDLALQGGLIGLALFGLLLVMVARWADRAMDRDAGLGFLVTAVLLYLLVLNLLETTWLQGLSTSSTLIMLFMLCAAVTDRPEETS